METLLVGLQSFMYEESNAIGSLQASAAGGARAELAAASRSFNRKNQIFLELFCAENDRGGGRCSPIYIFGVGKDKAFEA